jgi:hypothetical protein
MQIQYVANTLPTPSSSFLSQLAIALKVFDSPPQFAYLFADGMS